MKLDPLHWPGPALQVYGGVRTYSGGGRFAHLRRRDPLKPHETLFVLEDPSPPLIAFDLKRLVRTKQIIDDFQQTCFIIDSFEALPEACCRDFGNVSAESKDEPDFEAHEVGAEDGVITPGSHAYFEAGGRRGTGRIIWTRTGDQRGVFRGRRGRHALIACNWPAGAGRSAAGRPSCLYDLDQS